MPPRHGSGGTSKPSVLYSSTVSTSPAGLLAVGQMRIFCVTLGAKGSAISPGPQPSQYPFCLSSTYVKPSSLSAHSRKHPSFSLTNAAKCRPHCFRLAWQTTARACRRARCNAGIRIATSSAITAMTTNSSIRVNARGLSIRFLAFMAPALLGSTRSSDAALPPCWCSAAVAVRHLLSDFGLRRQVQNLKGLVACLCRS